MAIHLIRHDDVSRGLPAAVLGQLATRAGDAGHTLVLQHCSDEEALRRALDRAEREGAKAVLLDPGALVGDGLRRASARSRIPVVEVHDDGAAPWEPSLRDAAIHGYGAQGYTLALAIALESVGCMGQAGDVQVGT